MTKPESPSDEVYTEEGWERADPKTRRKMKKYLWLLIFLPLVGLAPAHMVLLAGDGSAETSEETMTWYQCVFEARKVNKEMKKIILFYEQLGIKASCRFGSG